MLSNLNTLSDRLSCRAAQCASLFLWLGLLVCGARTAYAQSSFNSGSTGADGAFNPTTSQTIQLPDSGIFNYTTVNIPSNVSITYKRNARNTPVIILATGNVNIAGQISVYAQTASSALFGGSGGPGGFDGGRGGTSQAENLDGFNGSGPGGGGGGQTVSGSPGFGGGGGYATQGEAANNQVAGGGAGGTTYGSSTTIPLIGGSGGGGGASATSGRGGPGGGGGGAILIASSGFISGSGAILAFGGNGGCSVNCGGGGSGGAIRLVANTISGNLSLQVYGGIGGNSNAGRGGAGYIRIEAFDISSFTPGISPPNAVVTNATPRSADTSNAPQLRIASVGGVNAPTYTLGTFSGADITLPTTQTSPVTVALAANNLPLGTVASVKIVPQTGAPTSVQSTALTGTQASSTATASVTLPNGMCLIYATVTVDVALISSLKPIIIDGEKVQKMEIGAAFGGKSEVTYITESGKRIKKTE